MKAYIIKGKLVIEAENDTEEYALSQWKLNNVQTKIDPLYAGEFKFIPLTNIAFVGSL